MNDRGYPTSRGRVLEAPTPADEFRALPALRKGLEYSGAANQDAVALLLPHVQLFNPPDSIVELVVEEITLFKTSGEAIIELRTTTTPLATFLGFWRQRDQGHQFGRAELRRESLAAALGNRHELWSIFGLKTWPFPGHSYVLFPGEGLIIDSSTPDAQIGATFHGRERVLDPEGRR